MNHIYRLVWNRAKRVMQVVSEISGGGGGGTIGMAAPRLRAHPLALACGMALWLGAALPAWSATCVPGATATCSAPGGDGTDRSGAGGAGNGDGGGASVFAGGATTVVVGSPGSLAVGGAGAAGENAGGAAGPARSFVASPSAVNVSGATLIGFGGSAGPDGFNFASGGGGGGAALAFSAPGLTMDAGAVMTGGNGGAGGNGTSGIVSNAGGGGGGGAAVAAATANVVIDNAGALTGGAGGAGGAGGFAGGGGGGGDALLLLGIDATVINSGHLVGGQGGAAGVGSSVSGQGGAGGAGLNFAALGGTLVNTGTIAGGAGAGTGAGGSGVLANGNVAITNSGAISGGLNGDGVTRASAIRFDGTGNTLTLLAGSDLAGGVALGTGAAATIAAGTGGAALDDDVALGSGSSLRLDASVASLNVAGSITGGGAVDIVGGNLLDLATTDVASLHDAAGILRLHGNVTTTGSQTYDDRVDVWSSIVLTSTGNGDITFNGTVYGTDNSLTVNTGGTTRFGPVLGGGWGPLYALTTDAAGTTELNGDVTTNHEQVYNDQVQLGADVVLTSALDDSIALLGGVDGAHALTISTGGFTTFGTVGATTALASLATDAGGSTQLLGNVTTTGNQTYGDAVVLGAPAVTLTSTGGGTIQFNDVVGPLAGALTVSTGGGVFFGNDVSLAALAVDAGTFSTQSLSISGNLSVATAGGNILQPAGAYMVGGAAGFDAGAFDIVLASAANDFAGTVRLAGRDATVTDANALRFGTLALGGDLIANSTGAMDLGQGSIGGDLQVATGGGALTQSGALSVGGNSSLQTLSGNVTLTNAGNDFTGRVSAIGSNVAIADANDLTATDIVAGGHVDLSAAGVLSIVPNMMAYSIAANGVSLVGDGGIRLAGGIRSGAELDFDGAVTLTGDALLSGTGNTSAVVDRIWFMDGVDGAHALTAQANGDLKFGDVGATTALTGLSASGNAFGAGVMNIDGALSITTSGAGLGDGIVQNAGGWTVTGDSVLHAGPGGISLMVAGNDFQGTVDAAGSFVAIHDDNDLDIAALANGANGDVRLTANGTLTLPTGAIDTGTADLVLASGTGTLATPGALSGRNVFLQGGGGLTLGHDVTATGGILLSSGGTGSIVQTGGALVAASLGGGPAVIGDIVLESASNDIGMLGGFEAASFSLVDSNFMRIDGHSTVAGDFRLLGPSFTLVGSIDAGDTVLRSGTVLAVGDGGTAGTLIGDVTVESGSALFFRRSDDIAYAGAIGGTGGLGLQTLGTLVLNGDSSAFAGHASVDSGTLIVGGVAGNGAALGGDVDVSGFGTLGGHGAIGGNVELFSTAHLAPGNSIGTLTIGGDLTLHDGNVLDFEFGAPGTPLSSPGIGDRVDVGGNLAIGQATLDLTDAGGMGPGLYTVLTWGGALTQANGGLALGTVPAGQDLRLQVLGDRINLLNLAGLAFNFWNGNGAATASQLGGGSGTWSATSANWTDAAALATRPMSPQPGFAIFGGAAGTVNVDDGAGAVAASGLQFASDGYRIEGDALTLVGSGGAPVIRVGDGSAAGAAMTATIDSVVAGSDGLRKEDAGTLVLSGANTYGGGTTVAGGTLLVATDANLGAAGEGITLDGGTLAASGAFETGRDIVVGASGGGVRSDAAMTLDGAITGTGTLWQTGSGTLVLGGDSSAFAGTTSVASGTLVVGDSAGSGAVLGGDVAVAAGAVLGGHGRIEGDLANAGVVAPGNSIGTLTIGGDYTQAATGVLQIEATEDGGSDKLVVEGAAALDGSLLTLTQDGDWRGQVDYTILTAGGGVTGRFAGASSSLVFLDPLLAYGADAVTMTLRRNEVDFASVARTPNQAGVAAAADALGWGHPVYEALTTLDAARAQAAFDSLSGEIHAATRGALLGDARQLRDALTQQLATAEAGDRGAAWFTGWGHWSRTDADGNAAAVDGDGSGFAVGGDLPFGDRVRLGAMLGSGRLSVDSDARASRADVDSRHAGAYALVDAGVLRLQGGVVRSTHDVDSTRTAAFGDLRETLRGDADASTTQSYLDASHGFAVGRSMLAPFVNVARIRVRGDAFDEAGGDAALHVDAGSDARTVSTLGARWDWASASKALRLQGTVAWAHAAGAEAGTATQRFAGGSTAFDVSGPALAGDAIALDLGLRWQASARTTFEATYNGRFGDDERDQGARVSLRVGF